MRDTASANPEAFIMGYTDAWYLINAIYAVLDLDDEAARRLRRCSKSRIMSAVIRSTFSSR